MTRSGDIGSRERFGSQAIHLRKSRPEVKAVQVSEKGQHRQCLFKKEMMCF